MKSPHRSPSYPHKLRRNQSSLPSTQGCPTYALMALPFILAIRLARLVYRAVQRWSKNNT